MKRIGVTYSPVLDAWPEIKELVDTIEIPNLSYLEMASGKPWTYHLRQRDPYNREMGSLNMVKPEEVMTSLEKSKTAILMRKPEIISVHLGPAALETEKDPIDNHIIALDRPLPRAEVMKRLAESIDCLLDFTDAIGVPLAVENLDYHHAEGAYEYVCEPEFIKEIFAKYEKLYLLLDIAHAEISAVALFGREPRNRLKITKEYLESLPLGRAIEIHINSPIWQGGNPFDMHLPITETEKRLLKFLSPLPNLRVINLECESKIKEQLNYLRKEAR